MVNFLGGSESDIWKSALSIHSSSAHLLFWSREQVLSCSLSANWLTYIFESPLSVPSQQCLSDMAACFPVQSLCTRPESWEENGPLLYLLIKGNCLCFCPKIGPTCCWHNATNQCYKNSISLENFSICQRGASLLLSSNHCKHKSQCLHFREPWWIALSTSALFRWRMTGSWGYRDSAEALKTLKSGQV